MTVPTAAAIKACAGTISGLVVNQLAEKQHQYLTQSVKKRSLLEQVKSLFREYPTEKVKKVAVPVQEKGVKATTPLYKSMSCPNLTSNSHEDSPASCQSLRKSRSAVYHGQSTHQNHGQSIHQNHGQSTHQNHGQSTRQNTDSMPFYYKIHYPLQDLAAKYAVLPFKKPGVENCTADVMGHLAACNACPGPCSCCPGPCGVCLPPPCKTPAKCLQYMTGYYYYPYGFWFCGPYHVTGTCYPVGPVSPGGPCGPCPPKPGGPCGPCGPGFVCGLLDPSAISPTAGTQQMQNFSTSCSPLDPMCVACGTCIRNPCPPCKSCAPCRRGSPYGLCNAYCGPFGTYGPCGPCGICGPCGVYRPGGMSGPCGCGPYWPGSCGPFGCACQPFSCVPCTPYPCGPCGCGRCGCGPCGCGPCGCGPCGCGPCGCGPCGCGPCRCGPCGCRPCSCGPCGCGCYGPCGACRPCGPCGPCRPCGPCGPCFGCCCIPNVDPSSKSSFCTPFPVGPLFSSTFEPVAGNVSTDAIPGWLPNFSAFNPISAHMGASHPTDNEFCAVCRAVRETAQNPDVGTDPQSVTDNPPKAIPQAKSSASNIFQGYPSSRNKPALHKRTLPLVNTLFACYLVTAYALSEILSKKVRLNVPLNEVPNYAEATEESNIDKESPEQQSNNLYTRAVTISGPKDTLKVNSLMNEDVKFVTPVYLSNTNFVKHRRTFTRHSDTSRHRYPKRIQQSYCRSSGQHHD